jgi:shikimate 5-dehydrogenase
VKKEVETAGDGATIVSMIAGGSSYAEIASALGKGLKPKYISNRWQNRMKEWSNIIKPTVQPGRHSSITWTAGDGERL